MKAMDEFQGKMMKDLKVSWDSVKRSLSFTRHLINGAPVPKDVVFPAVHNTTVGVSWSCDEEKLCKEDEKELVCYV